MAPVLLAVVMWRRTYKMRTETYVQSIAYWLVAAIEAADLMELAVRRHQVTA